MSAVTATTTNNDTTDADFDATVSAANKTWIFKIKMAAVSWKH